MKFLQNLASILHLHNKWVRRMLLTSFVIIIILLVIPVAHIRSSRMKVLQYDKTMSLADSLKFMRSKQNLDSVRLAITNIRTQHSDTVTLYRESKSLNDASHFKFGGDTVKEYAQPAPPENKSATKQLEEVTGQVLKAKEPFDWKGTVTWGIGVLNGLVLVVLNIRNIILKGRTP